MAKFAIVFTACLTVGTSVWAQETLSEFDAEMVLPQEVAVRVAHLREYGDRYEGVIKQIVAEAAKPSYSGDGCHFADLNGAEMLPES